MSVTRRIYFYVITLVSLVVFAIGVGQLLALLFDVTLRTGPASVGRQSFSIGQLSLGLAMMVIAGPLWFFFWRAIQRRIAGREEEIGSAIRKIFLNIIIAGAAIAALVAFSAFIRWLTRGAPLDQFPAGDLATLIVTAAIWFYHRWVSDREGHPSRAALTLRRWYVYILSGLGLVWVALGIVQFVSGAVLVLPVWSDTIVRGRFWSQPVQLGVSFLVPGAAAWYYHWFRMAKGDFDSVLRQVYFYLLTVSGGAIAALTALTTTLYLTLRWAFGAATIPAGHYFDFLSWSIITAIVGAAIWAYHQRLVQEEQSQAAERRLSARRVHLYLMSFIGLGTLAAGVIVLFGVLFRLAANAASPPVAGTASWWKDQLSLSIALLVVGAPLWLYYWSRVLEMVDSGGPEERRSRSRRVFLYIIVGASIGGLIADLVNIVYQVLNAALQGTFGGRVLHDSVWSLQSLFVAAPLLWYHWRIVRADQRAGAELIVKRKTVTLLAVDPDGAIAERLSKRLGYRVRPLQMAGGQAEQSAIPDDEIERAAADIEQAPTPAIMVVLSEGKITVYPYRER